MNFTKRKKGFNLIEVILTLGFIAVAIAASLFAYNKANYSSKINKEKQNMMIIVNNIRNAYSNQANYNSTEINEDIVQYAPPEMIDNGKLYHNLSKGSTKQTIEIRARRNNSPLNPTTVGPYFSLNYENLDPKYCQNFVLSVASLFDIIKSDKKTFKTPSSALDVELVAEECSSKVNAVAFITL